MSAGATTASTGSAAAATANGGEPVPVDVAGRLLARLTVLPALLVIAWLLVGLPLLLLGHFTAVLMLVFSIPLAALLVVLGLRWTPGRWESPLPVRTAQLARTPWWAVLALVAVAVAFGADQLIFHSQQIIVQRDPASYIQFSNWIAGHGSLPIPENAAAFGHRPGLLNFESPAFYQAGKVIVPQFMAGLPMILAAGFWIGGIGAAVLMAPVLGALGVLTFGGLAARLIGPRWAPLAALALALTLPEMFTSRSSYSEPAAQILFLGGLCLVIDSFGADGVGTRVLAALGGIALGLTLLARIDGASDLLPVVPYAGILLLGRRRQAWPLIGGVALGAGYGLVDGVVLSRPYLIAIKGSLLPLALGGGVILVATAVVVLLLWRRGLPQVRRAWLPNALATLAFLVTLGFVIRPYVQTVHGARTPADLKFMRDLQTAEHLAIQPTRLYYEISLHWIFWYAGIPAVILATIGAAVLARRCVRGRAATWVLPLISFAWIIVATLLRPAITPDMPWASRRLVPGVLPGFILLAVWASAWIVGWLRQGDFGWLRRRDFGGLRWLRRRGVRAVLGTALAAVFAAALVLPPARTSWGLAHQDGGPVGVKLVAVGLADKRTYQHEIAAVNRLCAAIPRDASVLIIRRGLDEQLAEVIRGTCGVPVAGINLSDVHVRVVKAIVRGIQQAGRQPVLLAQRATQLTRYGARPRLVMVLHSRQDEHSLTHPPTSTPPFRVKVWMSEPPR
jgi:hypothetical protein